MKLFFTSLLVLCICSSSFSQSLVLNKHFGTNGIATTNFGNDVPSFVTAVAAQPDGKIIIAGDNSITRVFADGTPDSSFGENGTCFFHDFFSIAKVLIQSDGKIMVVNGGFGGTSFSRVLANGTIDYSYGTHGDFVLSDINGDQFFFYDCALTTNNRIAILGTGDGNLDGALVVGRLLANGGFDSSFNGNGSVIIKEQSAEDMWNFGSIAVQSTGKIIVAGTLYKGLTGESIELMRFNTDGSADNSFNNTGRFSYVFNTVSGTANTAMLVQSNDGILFTGGEDGQIFAIKLLANGQADPVFNGNGIAKSDVLYGQPIAVFLRPNGKVLIAGMVSPDANSDTDYGALQFNANGTADAAFGTNGATRISVGSNDVIAGAVLQADGSFSIFGFAWDWDAYIPTAVKLTSTGIADNSFGSNGIKKLMLIGSDDGIESLIEQPDKKLLAGGWKTSGINDPSRVVIVRYKTDGKSFDSTFGIAGRTALIDPALNFLSMGLQSTGKIILNTLYYSGGDSSGTGTTLMILKRFNSNGTIDNSFGTAGSYVSNKMQYYLDPVDIKVSPDDKILICYNQHMDDGSGITITRLTANGLPDNSFGTGGTVILNTDSLIVQHLEVQPDGKMLISAKHDGNDSSICFLIRLTSNGSYDVSFDGDGIKRVSTVSIVSDGITSFGLATDGKIIAALSLYEIDQQKFITTVYRFNADGSPDLSFNNTGRLVIPATANFSSFYAGSCVMDKDNSIYIFGEANSANFDSSALFIIRVRSTGVIDTTVDYANNGFLYIPDTDVFGTLTVLADSSLVLAGGQEQSFFRKESDFFISKYKRLVNGYRFIGNGNWSNPANWEAGKVPPAVLPAGSYVYVQPTAGGKCILDISQQISSDDNIVIASGKNLIITGNLIIK